MARKSGLGRGLSSILGEVGDAYEKELGLDKLDFNNVVELSIEKIQPNPYQPRKIFDEVALEELAASIKDYGLIQPIIVLQNDDKFILVAGERRLRACESLGFESIKAVIANFDEKKLRELALIENIQRENLNPIELATSYKNLIEEYEITQDELAKFIHKSRPQITNTLRLLQLSPQTQEYIVQGKLTQGHGKILVGLSKDDEKMLVDTIIGQRLSSKETEKLVQNLKNKNTSKQEKGEKVTQDLQNELKNLQKLFLELGFTCKLKNSHITLNLQDLKSIKKLQKLIMVTN